MGVNDPNLGTLEVVTWENMLQFLDVLNRNFAVVQNSPLFKGVPGDDGDDGDIGPKGQRGSKFLFVDFLRFNTYFPNELQTGSQIDIVYLNSKLQNAENKLKLLQALNTPDLVDNDIFILTNSKLLNYVYAENKLHDTNLSFNTSVTTEIQSIIEQMFNSYIPTLQASIKNVYEVYNTLAKNYSDNNNTGITTSINNTSVFSPYINGLTPNIGIPVDTHKYYSLNNNNTPENNNNTTVFGSIYKFYKLLMNTLNSDGSNTLTSEYAPGVNNIPALVLLQDTYNAGILIGYKNKNNLKTFGSLFKNDKDELVIKSDSGNLPNDSSNLRLHRTYMKFDKLVQFSDSLELSHNASIFGELNQRNFKTGVFAADTFEFNNQTNYELFTYVGNNGLGSETIFNGEKTKFTNFKDKVLITDAFGYLGDYTTEKTVFPNYEAETIYSVINPIGGSNPRKYIISAYHFNYLSKKINTFYNQINGTFWTKAEFGTGVIPSLHLNNFLIVKKNVFLGDNGVIVDVNNSRTNVNSNTFSFTGDSAYFQKFSMNVLVAANDGNLRKDVFLDYNYIPALPSLNEYPYLTEIPGTTYLITTKHYNGLLTYLNNTKNLLLTNYWNKADFNSYIIPNITVNNKIVAKKGFVLTKNGNVNWLSDNSFFLQDDVLIYAHTNTDLIQLGNTKTQMYWYWSSLKTNLNRKFLWFDAEGNGIPVNRIGTLPVPITQQVVNDLNNGDLKVADNNTIASILQKQLNDYSALYNYTTDSVNNLDVKLTIRINNLETEFNVKINQINASIVDIYNVLATKADLTYVNGQFTSINNSIGNLNTRLNQAETDITWLKNQLNLKANQSDLLALKAEFDDFKSKTAQIPKNAIMLWEGVNGQAAIPAGWEEVTSMRGRVAVGWMNGAIPDYNTFYGMFNSLGEIGGTSKHVLKIPELPNHAHSTRFGRERIGRGDGWWGFWFPGNNDYGDSVGSNGVGNDLPHNNTQPYKTLIYIRSLKGI